ncbi:importin subunit alpha-2-like protein [Tanacetum coccineum]
MPVRDPQLLFPRLLDTCAGHGVDFKKLLFVPTMSIYNKVGSSSSMPPTDSQVNLSWQPALQRGILESNGHVYDEDKDNDEMSATSCRNDTEATILLRCIIEHGALPCLLNLLVHNHKKSIKKEACWTISNITAGNKEQIQSLIEAGLIAPLVNLLQNSEFNIKKEAAWAISNTSSGGSNEQIKYLVSQRCIKPLCDLMSRSKDYYCELRRAREHLKVGEVEKNSGNSGDVNYYAQLIDDAEGPEKFENLQSHGNNEIYEKAVKILETYWLEEEEEAVVDGSAQQEGFNFGGNNEIITGVCRVKGQILKSGHRSGQSVDENDDVSDIVHSVEGVHSSQSAIPQHSQTELEIIKGLPINMVKLQEQ